MGGKRVKYLEKVPTSVMDDPKSASIGDSNRACMMQHITHSAVDKFFGLVWDFKPMYIHPFCFFVTREKLEISQILTHEPQIVVLS